MAVYTTNGRAIKALSYEDMWGSGLDVPTQQGATGAYAVVPFIRRATTLRANAVARVPWGVQRGTRDVSAQYPALTSALSDLLWRTEAALCLSPYGATWRRSANAAGLNPTPEFLIPRNIWPFITAERGLAYFRYTHPWGVPAAGSVEMLQPDEVVYFWHPNLDRASWPGVPPGVTAAAAAGVLSSIDTFFAQYFARGAIKSVILSVPPESKPDDRQKLVTWWRSLTAGVTNAWRTVVVSSAVTPVVLGDGLKDIENDKLVAQYRQDTAAAFGIPETMLMQGAANYATAQSDRISFYEETVFPACELIKSALNAQWLGPDYDVEIVYHPEQTEARQDAQVQQAAAITDLVGQPVLTVDEGRAWLGMDPLPKDEELAAPEEPDDAAAEQAEDAEEQAAEEGEDTETKALPGAEARRAERGALYAAHGATRATMRERHAAERRAARERHISERREAPDARARLQLTQRQRNDLELLRGRHASERGVMRSLHASERGRLYDRHAAQRAAETIGARQAREVAA